MLEQFEDAGNNLKMLANNLLGHDLIGSALKCFMKKKSFDGVQWLDNIRHISLLIISRWISAELRTHNHSQLAQSMVHPDCQL